MSLFRIRLRTYVHKDERFPMLLWLKLPTLLYRIKQKQNLDAPHSFSWAAWPSSMTQITEKVI